MIEKVKLGSSRVVYQNDDITKVEITVTYPEKIWELYYDLILNREMNRRKINDADFIINNYLTFSAVAKRSDSDNADPVVGVSVAEARAWIKAKKCYRRMLKELYNELFGVRQNIIETIEDVDSDIAHNIDYISRK